ncbi:MAG TPA: HAD hydrolase-like protein [Candidatus Butyricicoccus stercorigallinarum]|nr:HAD hydrolase-like protein [Candidatus Butyricicoccus stercorigallinarum]
MKDILFFDLDGTLTDSGEGITNCVIHALRQQRWPIPDRDSLRRFIGPPLIESFQGIAGMSAAQAAQAVTDYRARYSTVGLFENRAYDGIIDMLAALQAAGKRLFMVTSKPEVYSVRIAERFGLAPYLEQICGATLDGRINSKDAVVRLALERAGNPDPSTVEMIGDRLHDVEGARQYGIDCTYVLYGFGTREEAEAHRAAHIVATVDELREHLLAL